MTVLDSGHGGVSAARNIGMEHISGDLLYFADSDDELMPGLLSHVAEKFREDPELDLLVFSTDKRTKKGEIVPRKYLEPRTFTGTEGFAAICAGGSSYLIAALWGKVYNISRIGKENLVSFDTSIIRLEDKLWTLQMMQFVKKGRSSAFIGYIHNTNPESIMHQGRTEISGVLADERILEYIESREGKSGNYYVVAALGYGRAQKCLMKRVFYKGDEDDKKFFRSTLRRLHKELKGSKVKSHDYSWRKWIHYPLMLLSK